MTSRWVLLLTDDPLVVTTTTRLAASVGVAVHPDRGPAQRPGTGPPGLVVIGADRLGDPLPATATGGPRLLVSTGGPGEHLWRAALDVMAEQVVLLPGAEEALLDRLARMAGGPVHPALVIAVSGGRGGAGASVLAAALARAAAAVHRSALVEIDPMGSGADLLMGAEDEPGLRWPDLLSVRGRLLPGSVIDALPVVDRVHVLSWDRTPDLPELPAEACAAVLAAARAECGVVVVDLPRRLDPAAVEAARAADLALMVVPAEVRAAVAARRVATALHEHLADLRLVVRVRAPTGLRPEAVADALDLPLAGVLRPEPGLRAALERGEPPGLKARGPLNALCRGILAGELSGRSASRWAS